MNRMLLAVLLGASLAAAAGCTTESYCFDDCEGEGTSGTGGTGAGGASGTGGSSGTGGGCINCGGASGTGGTGTGGTGGCAQTNGGIEACDALDNDCDGETDEDFDLSSDPYHCGTCETNCTLTVLGAEQATCSATPGTPGECAYTGCSSDFYDLNEDPADGCEYYCVKQSDTDLTCDNIDDDCDGVPDNGIDFCSSATNCGTCGRNCMGKAGVESAQCVKIGDPPPTVCDEGNTKCEIVNCAAGFVDVDGLFPNGCEYACTKTKRTNPADPTSLVNCAPNEVCDIEYCDGVDNDCDGNVDGTDPDLLDPNKGDPALSKACTGASFGECAKSYHTGVTRCIAAQVRCVNDNTGSTVCTTDADCTDPDTPYCVDGPTGNKLCGTKVLRVNEEAEICDGLDNDCDDQIDVGSTDAGGKCGNNVGLCTQGTYICSNATLVCSGAINPTDELCDGADNDCDGVVDGTATAVPVPCQADGDCQALPTAKFCMNKTGGGKVCAALPSDIVTSANLPIACQVPPQAPAGWTSACQAGVLTCVSGAKVCLGAVTAQVTQDTCGVDADCNGQMNPVFNLDTDVHNCKACGTDCTLLGAHVNWICGATGCQPDPANKCMPGFIDCDGNPNDCERPCTKVSDQELCNGVDDNCSCDIDENVVTPSPAQVCGIGTGATGACLTTTVACDQGAWKCTYPAGHCTGASCASTPDICDGLDNNCNGNLDENFKPPILNQGYLGQACASDDNVTPKHGLCQQTGTYKCATTSTTSCQNAAGVTIANVKLPCGTLAGQSGFPCDEACDGQDNDCDGVVDEPVRAKGTDTAYWVKPNVVKLGAQNVWMFRYEATRPAATQTTPGTGNGWWRSTSLLGAQPTPPAGTTLDKTTACSVPSKVPWFNISGPEAQHVCVEMGGRLCRNSEWQSACRSTSGLCKWGFANDCGVFNTTTNWTTCNLGPFDFSSAAGNQDGLLPTGSSLVASCYANWGSTTARINDLTGNLRELTCPPGTSNPACTATTNNFTLMGGAFNTADPTGEGAACGFTFYNVSSTFKLFDVGFRCCFDSNPTI